MAQLYFRYSSTNAGKSIEIIKIAHNYEEQGKDVLIFAPTLDDRYEKGFVSSKIGLKKEAIMFDKKTKIREIIQSCGKKLSCILIDEGHFLTKSQVLDLTQIVDYMDIPVIVYGLKNDFQNNLFEGSAALLIYADKIEEVKTVCWFCNKKATMVLRIIDGEPVYTGEQIHIGGSESYIPVCRKCYGNPSVDKIVKK
jgi:thymidine kinase